MQRQRHSQSMLQLPLKRPLRLSCHITHKDAITRAIRASSAERAHQSAVLIAGVCALMTLSEVLEKMSKKCKRLSYRDTLKKKKLGSESPTSLTPL